MNKAIVIMMIFFLTTVGIIFVVHKKISQEVDQFVETKPVQDNSKPVEQRKTRRPPSKAKPIIINPETDFLKPMQKEKKPVKPKKETVKDAKPIFEPPTDEVNLTF